jgi:uncharacterized membrane protein
VIRRLRRQSAGQSFVEFALILPVVLMLLLMAADLGRVFLAVVTLNNTARVGARYAAANPGATYDQNVYFAQINNEWADIDCDKQSPIPGPVYSGKQIGDSVTVTLQCTFHVLTPLISNIVGSGLLVTSQAVLPVTSCDQTSGSTTNSICLAPPTAPPVTPPVPTPTPCAPSASTIDANPVSQAGIPGAALQYQITVTNNGSASQTYVLAYNFNGAPWTASFSQTNITVPQCGGSITSTLTVTSPSGAAQQTKQIDVSAGALTTTVAYVVTTCDKAPTVAATPASDTGLAGGPVTYAVTVTNNDPVGCGNRIFNLSASVPRNWSAVFAPTSLSIPPNGSLNSSVVVTSDPAATKGPVTITITASDPKGSGSTTVTYIVATCDVAPTITATPTPQTGLAGSSNVGYLVTVTSNDPIGCSARSYALSASFTGSGVTAAKWSATFSPSSLLLSPNQQGNSTMAVTSDSGAASGTQATITIASGGATFQVTYIVARCDDPPGLAAQPGSQTGIDGTSLNYSITVTSKDPVGCPSRSFALTVSSPPNGWSATFSPPSTFLLGPGQSGTSTLKITSKAGSSGSTTLTVQSAGASIPVTYQVVNCTAAPTVTVNPPSQSGLPGTALPYTVTVANNDPQPCTPRPFSLSLSSPPANWTASLAAGSLTIAAGSSLSTTATVTSSSSAGSGTTTLTVSTSGVSKTFDYVVTGCDKTPSIAANPVQWTGASGTSTTYTITVTNNDPNGCGSRTFALTATQTSGWTVNLSPGSVTTGPGSITTTLTVASPSNFSGAKKITVAVTGYATATVDVTYNALLCGTAPTLSPSSASFTKSAGTTVQQIMTVTNNDSAGCAPRTFNLTAAVTAPSGTTGWTVTLSQTSLTIPGGSSAPTTLSITSPANAPKTTYTITVAIQGTAVQSSVTYKVI